MLLASAVPVSVSVLSLVMRSPTAPLSVENEAMLGATGATVSTVTLSAAEAALVLPDTVSVAVKLCAPSGKGSRGKAPGPAAIRRRRAEQRRRRRRPSPCCSPPPCRSASGSPDR